MDVFDRDYQKPMIEQVIAKFNSDKNSKIVKAKKTEESASIPVEKGTYLIKVGSGIDVVIIGEGRGENFTYHPMRILHACTRNLAIENKTISIKERSKIRITCYDQIVINAKELVKKNHCFTDTYDDCSLILASYYFNEDELIRKFFSEAFHPMFEKDHNKFFKMQRELFDLMPTPITDEDFI